MRHYSSEEKGPLIRGLKTFISITAINGSITTLYLSNARFSTSVVLMTLSLPLKRKYSTTI
jgi:hypothetical protein